ncbi:MAG: TatD family hydrolase [Candidatus Altiarchaeota archaeon]
MLIDTHCHLEFAEFAKDREKIVEDCLAKDILLVNSLVDLKQVEDFLAFSKSYEGLYVTIGCGPVDITDERFELAVDLIRKHRPEIVGLGEVGLDYYWVKDEKKHEQQRVYFQKFISLSKELDLPLVVHSRESEEDAVRILEENELPAMLHCYSGSVELAKKAIKLGCLISIPTSIAYSNPKKELVRQLPLESIVLESDAPFLAPTPKTRNTPANIELSCEKIAEIKEVKKEEVEKATTESAKKFFGI